MDINEKLIRIFHELPEEFISGEELASQLGVSRTTVWNHINFLKQQGYTFDSQTNLGYRLVSAPDLLLPDEIAYGLKTRKIGRRICSYTEVDSTSDISGQLAASGAPEGTVVFAERQRRGRGRFDRHWYSPARKNILCSVVLRPNIVPQRISQISLLTAVAVAKTLRSVFGLSALIKWPNDVYVNDRKISGILVEMNAELDVVHYVIVGIGINVNSSQKDFPPSIRDHSTSIRLETGAKADRIAAAKAFLSELDHQYINYTKRGFRDIGNTWIDMSLSLGKRVKALTPSGEVSGIPTGLDEDGSLLIRLDTGIQMKISSGDLVIVEDADKK